jgi:hypothetical protein
VAHEGFNIIKEVRSGGFNTHVSIEGGGLISIHIQYIISGFNAHTCTMKRPVAEFLAVSAILSVQASRGMVSMSGSPSQAPCVVSD